MACVRHPRPSSRIFLEPSRAARLPSREPRMTGRIDRSAQRHINTKEPASAARPEKSARYLAPLLAVAASREGSNSTLQSTSEQHGRPVSLPIIVARPPARTVPLPVPSWHDDGRALSPPRGVVHEGDRDACVRRSLPRAAAAPSTQHGVIAPFFQPSTPSRSLRTRRPTTAERPLTVVFASVSIDVCRPPACRPGRCRLPCKPVERDGRPPSAGSSASEPCSPSSLPAT